jgi:hypothetical protein
MMSLILLKHLPIICGSVKMFPTIVIIIIEVQLVQQRTLEIASTLVVYLGPIKNNVHGFFYQFLCK